MLNLEPLAAAAAATMTGPDAATAENLITTALMVLSEPGVYAFGLFLATRKNGDEAAAGCIHRAVAGLLDDAGLADKPNGTDQTGYYKALTCGQATETEVQALQRLLLTKQVMEIALTYGRYHAKAHNTDKKRQADNGSGGRP